MKYFARRSNIYGKIYPTPIQNHKNLANYYHRAASIALQKTKEHRDTPESLAAASHGSEAKEATESRPTVLKLLLGIITSPP